MGAVGGRRKPPAAVELKHLIHEFYSGATEEWMAFVAGAPAEETAENLRSIARAFLSRLDGGQS